MGILGFLFGKDNSRNDDNTSEVWEDSEEDTLWIGGLSARREQECEADPSDFGQGQAEGRYRIDDMRRYYKQYGASSFKEAVEVAGKHAHSCYESEKKLVEQGYEERHGNMEFWRGVTKMYD